MHFQNTHKTQKRIYTAAFISAVLSAATKLQRLALCAFIIKSGTWFYRCNLFFSFDPSPMKSYTPCILYRISHGQLLWVNGTAYNHEWIMSMNFQGGSQGSCRDVLIRYICIILFYVCIKLYGIICTIASTSYLTYSQYAEAGDWGQIVWFGTRQEAIIIQMLDNSLYTVSQLNWYPFCFGNKSVNFKNN